MNYNEVVNMSYEVKCYHIRPNNIKRWIVLGTTKDYLVTHNSCTCRDFLLKIAKKETAICKHITLFHDALVKKEFDTYYITIQEYKSLRPYLMELKK